MSEETPPEPAAAAADAPPGAAPRATHAELVEAASLDHLVTLYRERGATGDREAVLRAIQADWHRLAVAVAREVTEPPPELPAVTCTRDGVRYEVYGVIHGMLGGDDAGYKAFVDAGVRQLERPLIENALGYFYPHKGGESIPDFVVFGLLGSIRLGLQVGVEFPVLIWETLRELLKLGRGRPAEEAFDYDPRYHAIDPETRRGLEPDPPLPSRLQIEYELGLWDGAGLLAAWRNPFALAPRSLFMAGYAVGYAEREGRSAVPILVGDLHTMEIARFLEDPAWTPHPIFEAARRFAARGAGARRARFLGAKLVHLLCSGGAGALVLVPVILLLSWLVWWR